MKLRKNYCCIAFAGLAVLSLSGAVLAEEDEAGFGVIEKIRFEPVEIHWGDTGTVELVPASELGSLPIPILGVSPEGFYRIELPGGDQSWVNRADVQVGGTVRVVCANERQHALADDHTGAHLRGVSRDCD